MEKKQTIYFGSTQVKETSIGEITKIGIKKSDLYNLADMYTNERGYFNISILTSREGKPYAVVDTYGVNTPAHPAPKQDIEEDEMNLEEIPF